jgi:hypothetical protein
MNYTKVYNNLISSRKQLNRTKDREYYELHHIVPRSLGGPDETSNLVLLTAKEHWIAHCLLSKMFFGANAYKMNQALINMGRVIPETKRKTSRLYESARKNIADYVSKKHRGTIVVVDKNTGIRIGRISKDHPKVLSGDYVFFHNGMKRSKEYKAKVSQSVSGVNNPRYSGISDNDILKLVYQYYLSGNFYIGGENFKNYCKKNKIPLHFTDFRFKDYGGGFNGFKMALIEKFNLCEENFKYIKTQEHKQKLSKSISNKKWYHNDELKCSKQLSLENVTKDWKLGRKKYAN